MLSCQSTPSTQIPIHPREVKIVPRLSASELDEAAQLNRERKEAVLKSLPNTSVSKRIDFGVKRASEDDGLTLTYSNNPQEYFQVQLAALPFSLTPTEQSKNTLGQDIWKTTAFQRVKEQNLDNMVLTFDVYLDLLVNVWKRSDLFVTKITQNHQDVMLGGFDFEREMAVAELENSRYDSNSVYLLEWKKSSPYTAVFLRLYENSKVYISSSPDGKGPLDIIGDLNYRISSSGQIVAEGNLPNGVQPEELVSRHNLNQYGTSLSLELYISKPLGSADSTLGSQKPIYISVLQPDSRSPAFLDTQIKGSRYFTDKTSSCPREVSLKVFRDTNVQNTHPEVAESVVDIYTPHFELLGSLPLSQSGNATHVWDGSLPSGYYDEYTGDYVLWEPGEQPYSKLPYGNYVMLARFKKRSSAYTYPWSEFNDYRFVHFESPENIPSNECGSSPIPTSTPSSGGTTHDICTIRTLKGGSSYQSCFSCPQGQSVIFDGDIPIGCSPVFENEESKYFTTPSEGGFSTQALAPYSQYISMNNNSCN